MSCRRSRKDQLPWKSSLSTTDEVHDFDRVAFVDERGIEDSPLEDDEVVLDCHAPRVDVERRQQFSDGERAGQVEGIAVQGDCQNCNQPERAFYLNCFIRLFVPAIRAAPVSYMV